MNAAIQWLGVLILLIGIAYAVRSCVHPEFTGRNPTVLTFYSSIGG